MSLPLPDRHHPRLSLAAFDLAVSAFGKLDRGQRNMPLASDGDLSPVAVEREARDLPVNRQIGKLIHPYGLGHDRTPTRVFAAGPACVNPLNPFKVNGFSLSKQS